MPIVDIKAYIKRLLEETRNEMDYIHEVLEELDREEEDLRKKREDRKKDLNELEAREAFLMEQLHGLPL